MQLKLDDVTAQAMTEPIRVTDAGRSVQLSCWARNILSSLSEPSPGAKVHALRASATQPRGTCTPPVTSMRSAMGQDETLSMPAEPLLKT